MISRTPALVAMAAAAALATACATSTNGAGAPVSNVPSRLTSPGAPTSFPTSSTPNSSAPTATVPTSATVSSVSAPSAPSLTVSSAPGSTTTGTWSLATARARYLAYVAPYNTGVVRLSTLDTSKKATAAQYRDVCQSLAEAQRTFSDNLLAGNWPASVRPALIEFIPLVQKGIAVFELAARQTTVQEIQATLKNLPPTTDAANQVRAALGLPQVK